MLRRAHHEGLGEGSLAPADVDEAAAALTTGLLLGWLAVEVVRRGQLGRE